MQAKFLVALALTGLTGSKSKDPKDHVAGTRRHYGVAVALGNGQAGPMSRWTPPLEPEGPRLPPTALI